MRTPEDLALICAAKQKLMRLTLCSEDCAYHALRQAASDQRRPMAALAQQILDSRRPFRLLGRRVRLLMVAKEARP